MPLKVNTDKVFCKLHSQVQKQDGYSINKMCTFPEAFLSENSFAGLQQALCKRSTHRFCCKKKPGAEL